MELGLAGDTNRRIFMRSECCKTSDVSESHDVNSCHSFAESGLVGFQDGGYCRKFSDVFNRRHLTGDIIKFYIIWWACPTLSFFLRFFTLIFGDWTAQCPCIFVTRQYWISIFTLPSFMSEVTIQANDQFLRYMDINILFNVL